MPLALSLRRRGVESKALSIANTRIRFLGLPLARGIRTRCKTARAVWLSWVLAGYTAKDTGMPRASVGAITVQPLPLCPQARQSPPF